MSVFAAECQRFYGRVLTGVVAHFCDEYDGLPNDETCGAQFWSVCGCMWTPEESCRDYARRVLRAKKAGTER